MSFLKMNKNKTAKIVIFFLLFLLMVIFGVLNSYIDKNRINKIKLVNSSQKYAYNIENISEKGDSIEISGWFFELRKIRNIEVDTITGSDKFGVYLCEMDCEVINDTEGPYNIVGLETDLIYEKRNDINNYFKCEYDYSNCGFIARIDKDKLDLDNKTYQIIIKPDIYDYDGIGIDAYIGKEGLSFINPDNFISPSVSGTDLEDIVRDGYCLVCRLDQSIYVYQYAKKLYWIADTDFKFENDGTTYIQYELETTQFDKLPINRIDAGNYWSNIGGEFELAEITDSINCGKYRVYVRDIPMDYSITQIQTGYYEIDKWIWKQEFRPLIRDIIK